MRVEYGRRRRTHEPGYVFVVPVDRMYELEFDLRERDRADVEDFTMGVGELRQGANPHLTAGVEMV